MAKVSLPKAQYIDLRGNGKVLARWDPVRGVLEIQDRGTKFYFDLTQSPVTVQAITQPPPNDDPMF